MVKVLVVDDERDVELLFLQRFRSEIRSGELELAFAFSGEEALGYLAHHGTDVVLVLSDINMPGMTGLELLKRIKAMPPPPSAPPPVCMMTAYGNDDHQRKAEEYGSDGYLVKPVDFSALKQQIRAFVLRAATS